jgi:hypothetical protein
MNEFLTRNEQLQILDALVPLLGFLKSAKEKEKLGEKVLHGKKLTNSEKEEIYRLITGNQPPPGVRRGRPPEIERDFNLAVDYLNGLASGKKGMKFRTELAKKYKLSVSNDPDEIVDDHTFFPVFKKGRKQVRLFLSEVIKRAKDGRLSNKKNAVLMARKLSKTLDEYQD